MAFEINAIKCQNSGSGEAPEKCLLLQFTMRLIRHLPNFITCLNLLCGCLAVVYITRNQLTVASWLVFAAAILDFADGLAARLLNAYSPLGKQLDSLADMVTFGFVPGFMMYYLLANSTDLSLLKIQGIILVPFLITIFSALRLAKFNIDERQTTGFIGLPTPASTLFVISIPLITADCNPFILALLNHPMFILVTSVALSVLMVAEIPMFSLKFKNWSWKENQVRYSFVLFSIILAGLLNFLAIPFIIIGYIGWSVYTTLFLKEKKV